MLHFDFEHRVEGIARHSRRRLPSLPDDLLPMAMQKYVLYYSATFQDPATSWTFQQGIIGPERSCYGERTCLHLKGLSERNMDNLHTQKLSKYAINYL